MPDWVEPIITINGQKLNFAQAMTVRVAIGYMAIDLNANGLGDDSHGKGLKKGYLGRISEIYKFIDLNQPKGG